MSLSSAGKVPRWSKAPDDGSGDLDLMIADELDRREQEEAARDERMWP